MVIQPPDAEFTHKNASQTNNIYKVRGAVGKVGSRKLVAGIQVHLEAEGIQEEVLLAYVSGVVAGDKQ